MKVAKRLGIASAGSFVLVALLLTLFDRLEIGPPRANLDVFALASTIPGTALGTAALVFWRRHDSPFARERSGWDALGWIAAAAFFVCVIAAVLVAIALWLFGKTA